MDIAAILSKIPHGRGIKVAAGIVTILVIGDYAGRYLDKTYERILSPSVFAAICLFILIFVCGVYMVQEKRGDHGSRTKGGLETEQEKK